jgi:hypothetical protein
MRAFGGHVTRLLLAPPNGPQLAFAPDTWKTFTDQLKATA